MIIFYQIKEILSAIIIFHLFLLDNGLNRSNFENHVAFDKPFRFYITF